MFESELELNSHLRVNYLNQEDNLLSFHKHWVKNLLVILKNCEYYPVSEVTPSGDQKEQAKEIIQFCKSRLSKYLKNIENKAQYLERLKLEIELFELKEYWNYLFIFFKLLQYIKEKEILTSAGRGSASSSLIIFLLGITQVDPLKYGLLLDRFLNLSSERVPDLDLDIESLRKQETLDYLAESFGRTNFVIPLIQKQIRNINLISSPLAKAFPNYQEPSNQQLLNKLINLPFLYQPHPSSLIPIDSNNPPLLHISEEFSLSFPVAYLEYNLSSYFSLQKFDILSSPYLDFISEILRKIQVSKNKKLQLSELDLQDQKTLQLINSGCTYYLFHLDNVLIKKVLNSFQVKSVSDLAQLISVIRPGINKHISKFLNYNPNKKQFSRPEIQKILSDTRGIILYQEQIMSIISLALNIPLYQTDKYRLALQKKDLSKLEKLKEEFFSIISNSSYSRAEQINLWEFIKSFGEYSFNKAHAIGYALSAYQAAYLKANYSEEFFLTLLEKEGVTEQILKELVKMDYQLELPSVLSRTEYLGSFSKDKKVFQLGLNVLKSSTSELTNRLQNACLKIESKNLKEVIFLLLEEGFTKEEILSLNYLNWFRKLFCETESQLFLHYNLDSLWNEWLFGSEQEDNSLRNSFNEEEVKLFEKNKVDSLKINLKDFNFCE
ncbi:DNA polymerase III subunit alpha [Mycoplasma wenyonii str. Massachusetts]|uniref:DNA polymerase III subunit alpha n=1 Tax=Mycoplasma wenyonii (strain Massachusetts) TaxID=1197325 RepID=I6Z5U8_MYCWM|nr:hypothetical protein [Mycoplasma wenyonii]AFN64943.1 DNA polymerase III subunit alpha [Mycoplasma wenyonii str. Massachusetts]